MKKWLLLTLLASTSMAVQAADNTVKVEYDPPQKIDARYRLFKTENSFNQLELDTVTGKVWQVQFSLDGDASRVKLPINTEVLAKDSKAGRFTLYPTRNVYNFILIDQENGKTWQVQFSTDGNQLIKPISESKNDSKNESKPDTKSGKSDTSWSQ